MTILKTPIPQSVMDSLSDYIANNSPLKFDANNTATGTTSATLNTDSGVVVYTTAIPTAIPKAYTLTNSKVKSTSKVSWSLIYSPLADEAIVPCYYQVQAGAIVFWIGMLGGTVSDSSIEIDFQILNP
jgi:hypothetical protein